MTVTVTLFAFLGEDQRVKTCLFQDTPEYMSAGESADLTHHEVLEFLNRLGVNPQGAPHVLQQALQQPPRVLRRRFDVDAAQFAAARSFLAE